MEELPALPQIEVNLLNNHHFGDRRGWRARGKLRNFNNPRGFHKRRPGEAPPHHFEDDFKKTKKHDKKFKKMTSRVVTSKEISGTLMTK